VLTSTIASTGQAS